MDRDEELCCEGIGITMWKHGDSMTLRGTYEKRIWFVQSAVIVKDSLHEVVAVVMPGAECAASDGYLNGKHGDKGNWNRWEDYRSNNPALQKFSWRTNRVLYILEPQKHYAINLFWRDDSNVFSCYYINFQLPIWRSHCGFDSMDLELDLIINPDLSFKWKDFDEYQKGIEHGIIRQDWIQGIEIAKQEIFEKIERRSYPFDGSWLNWTPDPTWSPPKLPEDWDKI